MNLSQSFEKKNECVLCGAKHLIELLHLAHTPIANQLESNLVLSKNQQRYPLDLVMCSVCSHIQIGTLISPEVLFNDYPYLSNSNSSTAARLDGLASRYINEFSLNSESFVVEIGSNDGYLLKQITNSGANALGIDPAESAIQIARSKGLNCIRDYFSKSLASQIKTQFGSPNLIIANNVLAHTHDLRKIFDGISDLMNENSVAVIEFSYVVDIYENLLIDTVYHEHMSYHSITPLIPFLAIRELEIFHVERFDSHGGSARIFVQKAGRNYQVQKSVSLAIEYEDYIKIHSTESWRNFKKRIESLKKDLHNLLSQRELNGDKIVGFGVPAKFTTLFYALDLENFKFLYLVDDNTLKIGKFAPGTALQIKSPDNLAIDEIDTIFLFSWNYRDELVNRVINQKLAKSSIIVPLPRIEIINI